MGGPPALPRALEDQDRTQSCAMTRLPCTWMALDVPVFSVPTHFNSSFIHCVTVRMWKTGSSILKQTNKKTYVRVENVQDTEFSDIVASLPYPISMCSFHPLFFLSLQKVVEMFLSPKQQHAKIPFIGVNKVFLQTLSYTLTKAAWSCLLEDLDFIRLQIKATSKRIVLVN